MAGGVGNRGKGRPKGALNKNTRSVKEALCAVYDQRGGARALLKWSNENETEFYKLWGRMLPQEVSGTMDAVLNVVTGVPRGSDD